MRTARNASLSSVQTDRSHDFRRAGRIRCREVTSNLGEVMNISASGMRLRARGGRPPAENTKLPLRVASPFGSFEVPAKVIWVERAGFRKWDIGVRYEALTKQASDVLQHIARVAPAESFTLLHSMNSRVA
jgi:hypothetical protein